MTVNIRKLALSLALTGLAVGTSLILASPAQAAYPALRVLAVHCVEETSENGDDSPYYLVFAASPTNPNATAFGKWGPGYLDNNVSTDEIHYPNATIISNVPSNWFLISIMLEEDDGNDLSALELQNISNNMYNTYQAWFGNPFVTTQLRATLWSMADDYTYNDDRVATAYHSPGSTVTYTGDGGQYRVRFGY
ncbi:hypothetical protein [Catelliglobosispora koreensis]|uniref:hypothetical protein n=1 Tax=Catelliglobosispora koreensis TaxID=129052 RepID=UPI0003808820|nr:hypothetical protein [Catelliglobosispora koreensis]